MNHDQRISSVGLIERVPADGSADLGYRPVARKADKARSKAPALTPPRGGSSTTPTASPPAGISEDWSVRGESSVCLAGIQPIKGDFVHWQLTVPAAGDEQEARMLFNLRPTNDPINALRRVVEYNELRWLSPIPNANTWALDLNGLRSSFPAWLPMSWVVGRVRVSPTWRASDMAGSPRTVVEVRAHASMHKA
jgi:hypothetical protein